jgi:cyclophilin family peptidyl-prolyl cis-trans isomerase
VFRSLILCSTLALAAQQPPASPVQAAAPAPTPEPAPKVHPRVRIDTSYGPIVVELDPQAAPATVANFLQYVKDGFYKGTIFHRVIQGFMIQGGGLTESLDEKPTRAAVTNEAPQAFKAGLKNVRGTLAMARTDNPQSASSQFYINTVDNPSLDFRDYTPEGYGYCVFGRVVSGMDVVDRIEKVHTEWRKGQSGVPQFPVFIKGATLLPPQ